MTVLGPYRMEAELRRMPGRISYRAHDRLRDRPALLEVFAEDRAGGGWRLRVWERIRDLGGPGVLPVRAFGELDDQLYLASDWPAAEAAAHRLTGGALAVGEALRTAEQIASVLDRVHAAGIAHGDFSANCVYGTGAGALLTGFGCGPDRSAERDGARVGDIAALGRLVEAAVAEPARSALRPVLGRARFGTAAALVDAARPVLAPVRPGAPRTAGRARPTAPAGWPPPSGSGAPRPAPLPPSSGPPRRPARRPAGSGGAWWANARSGVHTTRSSTVTIGRDPGCDVVLDDLLVSRRHAVLERTADGWRIVDRDSWNGTYVNGRRVVEAAVTEHDVIGIGHALLRRSGDTLIEYADTGDVTFRADDLTVVRSGRRLLDHVGFALPERSLLAVVGPSGAGKSTLLGALTGFRPAESGNVEYAGRDLYENYEELRQRIGLVPQDDILHHQLTVRSALRYAAQLRFPAETTAAEREQRVEEVLAQLGLDQTVARQRISTLSGGQRKRTSVALELLTRPSLLFLDEPTTGLDPGNRKEVMAGLRKLADEGRTVITVTHDESSLDICDRLLVLAKGGRLAYFGPPQEALAHFGQQDFPDMFLLLDRDETTDFKAAFLASPLAAKYLDGSGGAGRASSAQQPAPAPPPRQQPVGRQFLVLCRRYLAIIGSDKPYALFLAALPLVLSLFTRLLPGDAGLSQARKVAAGPQSAGDPRQLLLILILSAAFVGFAGAFRELVKEREIYRRERAIGLSRAAYLGSKLAVLGAIAVVQATVLTVLAAVGRPGFDAPLLGSSLVDAVVTIAAVTLVMMTLGLLVSAYIQNADRGMPVLVVVLMVQLVFCGGLFAVHATPGLAQASWLVPGRWGFALGASSGELIAFPGADRDPLWNPDLPTWLLDLGVLIGLGALFVLGTALLLRRLEPRRR
jgi:ABC-type multidrug transport system ATPase subunit